MMRVIEFLPTDDVIGHETHRCVCGPVLELPVGRLPDGTVGVLPSPPVIRHHRLDLKEQP